jgi:hypothetical protein
VQKTTAAPGCHFGTDLEWSSHKRDYQETVVSLRIVSGSPESFADQLELFGKHMSYIYRPVVTLVVTDLDDDAQPLPDEFRAVLEEYEAD